MAQVVPRTGSTYTGPCEVTAEHLLALDKLIDDELVKLTIFKESQIAEAKAKRLLEWKARHDRDPDASELKFIEQTFSDYEFKRDVRKVTVALAPTGKGITAARFDELIPHGEVRPSDVTNVKLEVRCGLVEAELAIEAGHLLNRTVQLSVRPQSLGPPDDFFNRLDQWCVALVPTKFVRWWATFGDGTSFLVGALPVIVWIFFVAMFVHDPSPKVAARELLESGIKTPAESRRALELLLSIAADYPPAKYRPLSTTTWIVLAAICLVVVLSILFAPRTIIGLGLGKNRLGRQQSARSVLRWVVLALMATGVGKFVYGYLLNLHA